MLVINSLVVMFDFIDLDTSTRVYTITNLILILSMFLVEDMTTMAEALTSIHNNNSPIGFMLILYKATYIAIMIDMTI